MYRDAGTLLLPRHTYIYIHNWSLQTFSQADDQASHTTYVVFENIIYEWRDLQSKVDSEQQIFSGVSQLFDLLSEFFFTRNMLSGSRRSKIDQISFSWRSLNCGLNRDLTSRRLTHYLLDYGDLLSEKKISFSWRCLNCGLNRYLTSRKPTHYLTIEFVCLSKIQCTMPVGVLKIFLLEDLVRFSILFVSICEKVWQVIEQAV